MQNATSTHHEQLIIGLIMNELNEVRRSFKTVSTASELREIRMGELIAAKHQAMKMLAERAFGARRLGSPESFFSERWCGVTCSL